MSPQKEETLKLIKLKEISLYTKNMTFLYKSRNIYKFALILIILKSSS